MTNKQDAKFLIDAIVDAITDVKGEDITIVDLTEIENSFCDYFVICTGNSNTQVKAIASTVERKVRSELKERPFHTEGMDNAQWVLIDYTHTIVHVFQKEFREYYDIESLWGDAKQTAVEL